MDDVVPIVAYNAELSATRAGTLLAGSLCLEHWWLVEFEMLSDDYE